MLDPLSLINTLLPLISMLSVPITWFFTKRHFQKSEVKKAESEANSSIADVMSKNIGIYQNMLEDVEKRYEEKLAKRDEEIEKLELEIEKLKQRITDLEK